MAAIDDLKAEIAVVAADILAAVNKLAAIPPDDTAAIVQATSDLKAAVAPLEAALNPPAPVTPPST